MSPPATSLRERSKSKRRDAIRRAGLRLFAEHGFDGATVADVAEAAEVAPRTVSSYFPTKLDIAMSWNDEVLARVVSAFRAHEQDSFSTVIGRWSAEEAAAPDQDLAVMAQAMFDANPELAALSFSRMGEVFEVGKLALIAEVGLPETDPIFPVKAAAVGAAITEYMRLVWRNATPPDTHETFVRYLHAIIVAPQAVGV